MAIVAVTLCRGALRGGVFEKEAGVAVAGPQGLTVDGIARRVVALLVVAAAAVIVEGAMMVNVDGFVDDEEGNGSFSFCLLVVVGVVPCRFFSLGSFFDFFFDVVVESFKEIFLFLVDLGLVLF